MNEQLQTYLQNMVIEIDMELSHIICKKVSEIPAHLRSADNAIYFYTEMTKRIFKTTETYVETVANLTPENARKFVTEACYGDYDKEE